MNYSNTSGLTPPSIEQMRAFNISGYDDSRLAAEYERRRADIARALADEMARARAYEESLLADAQVIQLDDHRGEQFSGQQEHRSIAQ